MKQFTAWRVRQLGDGILEWTSPLGNIYTDHPSALPVHFIPDLQQTGATHPFAISTIDDPPPW